MPTDSRTASTSSRTHCQLRWAACCGVGFSGRAGARCGESILSGLVDLFFLASPAYNLLTLSNLTNFTKLAKF